MPSQPPRPTTTGAPPRSSAFRDFVANHDERWLFVGVYIALAVVLSIVLSLFWLVAVAALHYCLEYLRQAQYHASRRDIATHALWEIKLDLALVLLALAMSLYMDVVLGVLGLQSAARAASVTRLARFAAWQRNIRAFILLADDVARVVQIGVSRYMRRTQPGARDNAADAVMMVARSDGSTTTMSGSADATDAMQRAAAGDRRASGDASGDATCDFRSDAPGGAAAGPAAAGRGQPRSWRDPWTRGDQATLALLAASLFLIVVAPLLTDHSWSGATVALLTELRPFPSR
jgi:hypothetical protein